MQYDTDLLVPPRVVGQALCEATGDDRWKQFTTQLITGGKSNLTFRLTGPAGSLVLRRPPTGSLLPSAHDMGREARIQASLATTAVPVAPIIASDPDGSLFGTPFYVMGDIPGHVITDVRPVEYNGVEAPTRMTDALIDTLVALHNVDPEAVGLSGFGRPSGFMVRQLERWHSQWERSRTVDIQDVDRLASRLADRVPSTQRETVVHGDYRVDNCIFAPTDPGRIAAVLDWELATLGDPLADFGMLLFYWRHADEPAPVVTPAISRTSGFPRRDHLVERYVRDTGSHPDQLAFYEAFAHYKFAVITQGIAARVAVGAMAGQDFGDLEPEVARIAANGLNLMNQKD
ncbi:phosphotransferase family protein [Nocardia vinacea]|uniref:phosphotransferase family protein n=1 Tax=Nocardia vinacea TaxID=96468 RepID=UPI0002E985A9|nr:phosphotransferase family protein [Nocardia vinacea]